MYMSEYIHTTVLILHVIGAIGIVGSSFVSLFVLSKSTIPRENLKLLERIWKLVGPSIGIQLLTGIYLASYEWDEFGRNPLFWTKIILFVLTGVIGGGVVQSRMKAGLAQTGDTVTLPGIGRWALASFLIFVAIVSIGVILVESGS